MNQQHYLLKGTFFLTGAGLLTRIAGFFYKIFLSRTIGAGEIGLFQLTMPVCALCMAVCIGGIQTALSRFTAEYRAKKQPQNARFCLVLGLILCLCSSCLCAGFLFSFAPWIARSFLLEPLCAPILRIIAVSLPFAAIHACISGYFIGCKNVSVSAWSQVLEQLIRIGSVLLFFVLFSKSSRTMDASVMALGQIAGEAASSLFCLYHFLSRSPDTDDSSRHPGRSAGAIMQEYRRILSIAAPLGLNRTLLCVLQGIEAALLPQQLQYFGLGSYEALHVYGTLTGMTMPLLLFPTAVTGAVSTLLLPAVSEAHALHHSSQIRTTVNTGFQAGVLLGAFFLSGFLLFGQEAGTLLFCSELSGVFLRRLSLLCPFLYLNTAFTGILHGLGKTASVFIWNIIGFAIRICAVILFVPDMGMDAYFAGMILSQIFLCVCALILLYRHQYLTVGVMKTVLRAVLPCFTGTGAALLFLSVCKKACVTSPAGLGAAVCIFLTAFALPAWYVCVPADIRTACALHRSRKHTT